MDYFHEISHTLLFILSDHVDIFFRIRFGIPQILNPQSLLCYEILGILVSDFYHGILGILDLDVSFHCRIQEILDPEFLVCFWVLGILYPEFLFHHGILEILDID